MASPPSISRRHPQYLSGRDLHGLLRSGLALLESHVDEINSINVFPVPDRDTGTNMFDTLRHSLSLPEPSENEALGSVALRIAERSLYSARGNSGTLLSEFLRGFARELTGQERADPGRFARALRGGASAARAAVRTPVEGTILTVMNDVARASEHAGKDADDLTSVLEAAAVAARESLQSTPRLLAVLSESAVVDAGAAGFVTIIEGMVLALGGDLPEAPDKFSKMTAPQAGRPVAGDAESAVYGYCTEILLSAAGESLKETKLREQLGVLGESLVVIGTSRLLRIHIHATDPGAVLSECLRHGSLEEISIRNMDRQASAERDRTGSEEKTATGEIGVVAVATGKGFVEIFRSLGAVVVEMSDHDERGVADALLECVGSLPNRTVVVLPNRVPLRDVVGDIVDWKGKDVGTVEASTMPAGIAALIALDPASGLTENLQRMNAAAAQVQTIAIDQESEKFSLALGNTPVGGSIDLSGLVTAAVDAMPRDFELATVYCSDKAEQELIDEVVDSMRGSVDRVELHFGGQATPLFLVSLE